MVRLQADLGPAEAGPHRISAAPLLTGATRCYLSFGARPMSTFAVNVSPVGRCAVMSPCRRSFTSLSVNVRTVPSGWTALNEILPAFAFYPEYRRSVADGVAA